MVVDFSEDILETCRSLVLDEDYANQNHYVLVVHSAKGGSGKSTIALNLALQYASKGLQTVVLDLAMYGSIGAMLKMPHRGRGLAAIITLLEEDEHAIRSWKFGEHLRRAIVSHPLQGGKLDVLVAATPVKMDKLSLDSVETIIEVLKAHGYQMIIVDTSSEISARCIGALNKATKILLAVTPDMTCAWNTVQLQDIFKSIMVEREKVVLVGNRVGEGLGLKLEELGELIGIDFAAEIPEDYRLVQALANQGTPLIFRDGNAVSLALKELANFFYPIYTQQQLRGKSGSFISDFLRKRVR